MCTHRARLTLLLLLSLFPSTFLHWPSRKSLLLHLLLFLANSAKVKVSLSFSVGVLFKCRRCQNLCDERHCCCRRKGENLSKGRQERVCKKKKKLASFFPPPSLPSWMMVTNQRCCTAETLRIPPKMKREKGEVLQLAVCCNFFLSARIFSLPIFLYRVMIILIWAKVPSFGGGGRKKAAPCLLVCCLQMKKLRQLYFIGVSLFFRSLSPFSSFLTLPLLF